MRWFKESCPRLGDTIADMHEGVDENDFEVVSHICMPFDDGSKIIREQLAYMWVNQYGPKSIGYSNKMLVVMEERFRGEYACMYSYDGRYLGMVIVRFKHLPIDEE